MQIMNAMPNIIRVLILLCLFCPASFCASPDDFVSWWQPTVKLQEIGKGDLNRTHEELLDYIFPRQLSGNRGNKCYIVLRYLPAESSAHQLNLAYDESGNAMVWALELPHNVPLISSDGAQRLAATTHVSIRPVPPSSTIKDFLTHDIARGLPVDLRPGAILHADKYQVWGDCYLTHFYSEISVSPNSDTEQTGWMNKVWREAQAALNAP
jgi:hypothetical protein